MLKARYAKGRIKLKKGEQQRPNGTFAYRWTDRYGKRGGLAMTDGEVAGDEDLRGGLHIHDFTDRRATTVLVVTNHTVGGGLHRHHRDDGTALAIVPNIVVRTAGRQRRHRSLANQTRTVDADHGVIPNHNGNGVGADTVQ